MKFMVDARALPGHRRCETKWSRRFEDLPELSHAFRRERSVLSERRYGVGGSQGTVAGCAHRNDDRQERHPRAPDVVRRLRRAIFGSNGRLEGRGSRDRREPRRAVRRRRRQANRSDASPGELAPAARNQHAIAHRTQPLAVVCDSDGAARPEPSRDPRRAWNARLGDRRADRLPSRTSLAVAPRPRGRALDAPPRLASRLATRRRRRSAR